MDSVTGVVVLALFLVLGIAFVRSLNRPLRKRLYEGRTAMMDGILSSGNATRKERLLYEQIKEENGIVIWSPLLLGVTVLVLTILATFAGDPSAELSTGTLLLGITLILFSTIVVPLLVFYSELNGSIVVYELTDDAVVRRDLKRGQERIVLSLPWPGLKVSIVDEGGHDPDRFMVELISSDATGGKTPGPGRGGKRVYLHTWLVNFDKFCEMAIEKMPSSSFEGSAFELISGYLRRGGHADTAYGH